MLTTLPERNRPRSRAKVEAILAAAAREFRLHGYGTTSMDAVAGSAGVSKATLYAYFPSKQQLFAAVICEECDRQSGALLEVQFGGTDLREELMKLGRAVLDLLLSKETITSYRMVAAEATRLPELGRSYYENGAARLHARLESFLKAAMRNGLLRSGSPHTAAAQFIGLVRGDLMLRALLCMDGGATEKEKQTSVRSGVDSFCRAWCTGTPIDDR